MSTGERRRRSPIRLAESLARRVARRFTAPIYVRVDDRMSQAIDGTHQAIHGVAAELGDGVSSVASRLDALESRLTALDRHLPALLSTISSQNAAERTLRRDLDELQRQLAAFHEQLAARDADLAEEAAVRDLAAATRDREVLDHVESRSRDVADALHARIAGVEQRVEFVRREVLYELRFRGPGRAPDAPAHTLLDPTAGALRLNLGAGHEQPPGWIQVDARDLEGIDVVSDVRDLPCAAGSVEALRAAHLLEHFSEEELQRVVLPHWLEVLEPGGSLEVVVPDSEAMIEAFHAGAMSFEDLRTVTFGDQEYEGDTHHTMFSPATLAAVLEKAGFVDVEIAARGRSNGLCLEMEVRAAAPPGRAR